MSQNNTDMTDKKGLKTTKNDYQTYHCSKCDYTTCDISNWKRHIKTKKHNTDKRLTNTDTLGKKRLKTTKNWHCECGRSYKHRQSLFSHQKKCAFIIGCSEIIVKPLEDESKDDNLKDILDVMKDLIAQNKNLTESLRAEKERKSLTISGNNNNMNSHNTNFNIQLFLNEDCKNATSIQDFARQIKITMQDISLLKNNEPKAITNIITENLKDYTETERPFHHHKKKWYVKDEEVGWDKEGKYKGENIIKNVKNQVSKAAPKVFVDNHPNFLTDEKQGQEYAETVAAAYRDVKNSDKSKILKSIEGECEITN